MGFNLNLNPNLNPNPNPNPKSTLELDPHSASIQIGGRRLAMLNVSYLELGSGSKMLLWPQAKLASDFERSPLEREREHERRNRSLWPRPTLKAAQSDS